MKKFLKSPKTMWAKVILYTVLYWGIIACGGTGCKATLQQGGAYNLTGSAPDMPLFVADTAYQLAYNTIDAVFTTERNNRAFLWSLSPKIKQSLDAIRPQAVAANQDYLKARTAYIANPTPANLSGVQAVLAKIQQLATAAQAALPKGQ